MIKICIGADLVPTESNVELFNNSDINGLLGTELYEKLQRADYRVFNLEVPLVDVRKPIVKWGPNLVAPTSSILGIKEIGVDLLTLANNHILDQDVQGLESTMKLLEDNKIAYLGVGYSLSTASKPYIIDRCGLRIGFYACAEHEFSVAEDKLPGANPYDPLYSFDHVRQLKEECDFVIVLFHGGKEHYRYPSPMLQRIFRKFAEVGADFVVAQHSHCVGCMEEYNGSTLVYGQGNFLFNMDDNEYWNTAVLVCIEIESKGKYRCDYIPIKKHENGIELDKDNITIRGFFERSKHIMQPGFIQEQYNRFAKAMSRDYLYRISGMTANFLPFRILNKLTNYKLLDIIYNHNYHAAIENCFECEAHRELFVCYLQQNRMR